MNSQIDIRLGLQLKKKNQEGQNVKKDIQKFSGNKLEMPSELMDFSSASDGSDNSDEGWTEVTETIQPDLKVLHERCLVILPAKPISNLFVPNKGPTVKLAEE